MRDRPVPVIFRVAASAQSGGGHAARSIALAQALRARGATTCFVIGPEAFDAVPSLQFENTIVVEKPNHELPSVLQAKWPHGIDMVVVDDYDYDARMERELRSL